MLGHTWRRIERNHGGGAVEDDDEGVSSDDSDGDNEKQTLRLNVADYSGGGSQSFRARAKVPVGATYIKEGYLRGRFAADQCLIAAQINPPVTLPLTMAPRFSLVPMRHFVSDLAAEYNFGAAFTDFKTPLNPRQSAFPPTTDLKQSDGNSFPGGHHASGIFANAPVALMANQVSTSANVFTIHVVAQSVEDKGTAREDIRNSGPGYSDPNDRVMAERWARIVVAKLPPTTDDDPAPRFRVVFADYRKAAE